MRNADEKEYDIGESKIVIDNKDTEVPPQAMIPAPVADGYEQGKTNVINNHPGGSNYITDITGTQGPKNVAKTYNPSIRAGK